MKFKYNGKREGVFYGTDVAPGETYDFQGVLIDYANKSQNFSKIKTKQKKKEAI